MMHRDELQGSCARRTRVLSLLALLALSTPGCLWAAAPRARSERRPAPAPPGQIARTDGDCAPTPCDGVRPWRESPPLGERNHDRRPIIGLSIWLHGWWDDANDDGKGSRTYLPRFAGNGVPDAIDELLRLLDEHAAEGWPRIVLFLPGGQIKGQGLMPSSQWWTMPKWKRDAFELHIARWIRAHPDVSFGVYGGFRIADPCSLCMSPRTSGCEERSPARVPSAASAEDACVVHKNIKPWIDIGVKEYWFDASAHEIALEALAASYPDLVIGGEPIPKIPGTQRIDRVRLAKLPYMMTTRYLAKNLREKRDREMRFDGDGAAVHVIYARNSFGTRSASEWLDRIQQDVERGLLPWTNTELAREAVIRVSYPSLWEGFNISALDKPEDLNMDGAVDRRDLDHAKRFQGLAPATLYHGDLDGDGVVGRADLFRIEIAIEGSGPR